MAARKRKPVQNAPTFGPRDPQPRPFLGLLFLILGLLMALAVGDYHPTQNPAFYSDISDHNLIGNFGVKVASFTLYILGLAAYATPALAFWLAYMFFRPFARKLGVRKLVPMVLIFVSLAVFGSMYQIESAAEPPVGAVNLADLADNFFPYGWGGVLGFYIYAQFLREFLGMVGSLVVFGVFSLFSLTFLLFDNVGRDVRHLFSVKISAWVAQREQRAQARRERREAVRAEKLARKQRQAEARRARKEVAPLEAASPEPAHAESVSSPKAASKLKIGRSPVVEPFEPIMDEADVSRDAPVAAAPVAPPKAKDTPIEPPKSLKLNPAKEAKQDGTKGSNLRIIAGEEVKKAEVKLPERKGNYKYPPMRLLSEQAAPASTVEDASVHQQTAEMLVQTLEEFGVKVSPGDVHTGPVITRYDVYPAPGVRVEKIQNLDKNIALNLKALSVRILAPVPGKGCVGVEVPNKHPQSVFIRDILESADWANNKAEIPIALGKDVSGKPLIADLTKMPHLLIAGSTGSGKTVCINAVITSLLYHSSPEDLRFVMVDPKIVEMQVYNSLPHMLVPVVTDPKKVPNALKYLLNEMEQRYQLFASIGVRNIAGYNAKMIKSKREAREFEERAAEMDAVMTPEERAAAAASIEVPRDLDSDELPPEKLPYIVCIVDELADLMMVAPADIETGIARLAQLARAAGIHLILATQRPSVNVITGVIKANLPSRISFKVASRVDSRTILDTMGADHLIGKGDMLFLPPGSADLVRAQGAFVSDDEITAIVNHIHESNGGPKFDEQFQRNIESGDDSSSGGAEGEWEDDLVPDAINVIQTSKRASTSMLQRRLKIGYNRAARIMEILEAEGMVGPENGSSPREILMDLDL